MERLKASVGRCSVCDLESAVYTDKSAGVKLCKSCYQCSVKIDAQNETGQVVAFFDPKDDTVTTPPASVPARTWKMSKETKRWVLTGHDAANQASLLKQIEEAEGNRVFTTTSPTRTEAEGFTRSSTG